MNANEKPNSSIELVPSINSALFDEYLDNIISEFDGESDELSVGQQNHKQDNVDESIPQNSEQNDIQNTNSVFKHDSVIVNIDEDINKIPNKVPENITSGAGNADNTTLVQSPKTGSVPMTIEDQNVSDGCDLIQEDETPEQEDRIVLQNEYQDEENRNDSQEASPVVPGTEERRENFQHVEEKCNPTYLQAHLKIMEYLGLTPPCQNIGNLLKIFQWGLFVATSVFSVIHHIQFLKEFLLEDVKKGNLHHIIRILYTFNTIVLQLLYIFIMVNNKITTMLENTDKLTEKYKINHPKNVGSKNKMCNLLHLISLLSFLSAFIMGIGLDILIRKFDATELMQAKSYLIIVTLCAWRSSTYTKDADKIFDDAGKIKFINLALMPIQIVIDLMAWLSLLMIKDFMPAVSLDLSNEANSFKTFLKTVDNINDNTITTISNNQEYLHYLSGEYEKCFGPLFIANHIHNVLFCAYFFADLIKSDFESVVVIVRVIVIIKIIFGYWKAVKAYGTGGVVEQKLHDLSPVKNILDEESNLRQEMAISSLLQKVKARPIGIGAGLYLITQDFVYRFFQYVISWFLCFVRASDSVSA